LALPTEKSVRLSLRTQQILQHETGVTDTVDPLGGSYYVESLTRKMIDEINRYIEKIDAMGGAVAAIENGFVQKEIEGRAYSMQKEIEKKQRIVVGVNEYCVEEDLGVSTSTFSEEVAQIQLRKLADLKKRRDQRKVAEVLEEVRRSALGSGNLMPVFIEAVKVYATLGEICDVLRGVFGEYEQTRTI
jgi:methylmalonyl-CoA mutase N-terminal domain/subunit